MYMITYNYNSGETAWIVENDDVINCIVCKLIMEIDPNQADGIIKRKTYHLSPIDDKSKIFLREEPYVFQSLTDALEHIDNPNFIAIDTANHNLIYNYNVNDIIWINDAHTPLESKIIQITITNSEIDGTVKNNLVYHVLPFSDEYGTVLKYENEIFSTYQKVMEYITAVVLEVTLTPTITPTMTVTPNPTVTPTITPTTSG